MFWFHCVNIVLNTTAKSSGADGVSAAAAVVVVIYVAVVNAVVL